MQRQLNTLRIDRVRKRLTRTQEKEVLAALMIEVRRAVAAKRPLTIQLDPFLDGYAHRRWVSERRTQVHDRMSSASKKSLDFAFVRGAGLALAEAFSYGAPAEAIVCAARSMGLDLGHFKQAGTVEYDMEKLRRAGVDSSRRKSRRKS